MRVVGRGLDGLREFVEECKESGGIPVAQAYYAGVDFSNKLLVRCYGSDHGGGFVVDVPRDVMEKIAKSRRRYVALSEVLGSKS